MAQPPKRQCHFQRTSLLPSGTRVVLRPFLARTKTPPPESATGSQGAIASATMRRKFSTASPLPPIGSRERTLTTSLLSRAQVVDTVRRSGGMGCVIFGPSSNTAVRWREESAGSPARGPPCTELASAPAPPAALPGVRVGVRQDGDGGGQGRGRACTRSHGVGSVPGVEIVHGSVPCREGRPTARRAGRGDCVRGVPCREGVRQVAASSRAAKDD